MPTYLRLLRLLAQDYTLKFDGSTLLATPVTAARDSCRISLTVDCDEVLQSEGCTRSALVVKLATLLGLTPDEGVITDSRDDRIQQVRAMLLQVGIQPDYIGPENCQKLTAAVYLPGQKTPLGYTALRHQETIMLVPREILGDQASLSLITQDFLKHHAPVKPWRNNSLNRFRKQMDTGTPDMQLIRRLQPTLVQELGIPVVNGVLILS